MSMSAKEKTSLPAVISNDGWDDNYHEEIAEDRVIQGTILRCTDGHWSDRDGRTFPPDTKLLALATTMILQHWQNQTPVQTIVKRPGHPLPSVKELNDRIPESEWETGLDDEPRPPWQSSHVVYLLAEGTAEKFTYVNSTIGARIAVENLRDRVKMMRALRGEAVVPLVTLGNAPMKNRFGQKLRPEFRIVSWVELGVSIASEQPAAPKALPSDEERRAAGLIPEEHTAHQGHEDGQASEHRRGDRRREPVLSDAARCSSGAIGRASGSAELEGDCRGRTDKTLALVRSW
jgi:hypothetical protein